MASQCSAGERLTLGIVSDTSGSLEDSAGSKRPQLESGTTPPVLTDSIRTPGVSDPYPECVGQEQGKEAAPVPGNWPQHGPSSSRSPTSTDEKEDLAVITSMRATDIALGPMRIPTGFYIVVHHSGLEWRTENKPSSVDDGVVEWNRPIPIPSDLSATVRLEVYASFESQPILGMGEQLRRLAITVEQLLDHSEKRIPFTLSQKDGDISSLHSSILITVERQKCEISDSSASRVLGPHGLSESRARIVEGTNRRWDPERSIEEPEQAPNVCPLEHPCASAEEKSMCCQDLPFEEPLRLYLDELATRPAGHSERPSTLNRLAAVHLARFEKRKDGLDRALADALLHEARDLSSTGSHERFTATFMLELLARHRVGPVRTSEESSMEPHSSSCLTDGDLWIFFRRLWQRFNQFGDLADLHQVAAILEELVRSTPVWNDHYRIQLANLGVVLKTRFDHLGELSDLEDSISRLRDAVRLFPHDHPTKLTCVHYLSISLTARFERLGDLGALEDSISVLRDAIDSTPDGHPDKYLHLANLGNALAFRFERLGKLSDLEDALSKRMDAVGLIPDDHPNKHACLQNLGLSFTARYLRLGELSDLHNAISTLSRAIDLVPDGHPDKPMYLSSLGECFGTRFRRIGELGDLEGAISMLRNAVELTPHGNILEPSHLSGLGGSLVTRFQRLGELSDLQDAVLILRDAAALSRHREPSHLRTLGVCLSIRSQHLGDLTDLEDAIEVFRNCVDLIPDGHPQKPTYFSDLGSSIGIRFSRLGELSDLEDAVLNHKAAVDLTPDDHPGKPMYLNNLGSSLVIRFERLGELSDLEDAISNLRNATDLTPDGHFQKPIYLNHLGRCFKARFERLDEANDLEHAISVFEDAVGRTPDGHPDKPVFLNNLGSCFAKRFLHFGELSNLQDTISMFRDAVSLTHHGHVSKPEFISNLGNSLITRFKHLGMQSDFEDAVSTLREAVNLTPYGHPNKPKYLDIIGDAFCARFLQFNDLNDLWDAISLYSYAASSPIGPIIVRFDAARKWILCARHIRHQSLLGAYSIAIDLLPRLAWIGLSLTQRYHELRRGVYVVQEAAAAALAAGLPETAVAWLEQGRSIVWGEMFQLRNSDEDLSSAHPGHARRLRELSIALENVGVTREGFSSSVSGRTPDAPRPISESFQQEARRHRTLAIERDKLLQEIRGFPGFEKFLLHNKFFQLQASAHSGPVVILNAAEHRCDALVVLANVGHVIHVPLPNFTLNQSTHLQNMLKGLLRHARGTHVDKREGSRVTSSDVSWESLLSPLWRYVVKPVLDALAFSSPGDLSRIFWCPTGPFMFLPIHAAGLYDAQSSQLGHKVYDFVVSSYTPTLTALMSTPNPSMPPNGSLRLLAVRQPSSDGLPPLPGVAKELEHIKAIIESSSSVGIALLQSSAGTVEEVLSLMKDADWVHFACHGIQDATSPTDSGLCLADRRRLKLRDIIALSRPRGGLAFLSACETAMGDKELSDEAIHVAAGMLFAGYAGVIGTMWSISDRLAPEVARHVYAHLFGSDTTPGYREAARALHDAIERVRECDKASFHEWIPFIHVGL